jgi:hypothetical protein
MYALIQDSKVVYGPAHYNQRMFYYHAAAVAENMAVQIPDTKEDDVPIIISDTIKILPVTDMVYSELNPKIEQHAGPFWNILADSINGYFTTVPKRIDEIQNELKAGIAATRYKEEVKGIKVTVQGQEIDVETNREGRGMYLQAYQLGISSQVWKFKNIWLTLTPAELGEIVTAITSHVQGCFDWEALKSAEIDTCTTHEALNSVKLVYGE